MRIKKNGSRFPCYSSFFQIFPTFRNYIITQYKIQPRLWKEENF
jgi:hypothetical protein